MRPRAEPGLRVQLLATEHWSLLATRGTTQSEVLSRITTFLMLVSASIVSLGLAGQATHFSAGFQAFGLALLGLLVVVGFLTQMRVGNASMEDLAHVIGMNRLRAAYLELDPGIERFLVTSPHDDDPGLWQTYNHLMGPRKVAQPLASTGAFITFLNSALVAAFTGLVVSVMGGPRPAVMAATAGCGLLYLVGSTVSGARMYLAIRQGYVPRFPSSEGE